ncbi:MAG TPA: diaminopimelate epimerase [Gemmatimonadaceae bacterium]|nr:diaminopimelate epimerase [Gemmatimonadaceae bacterium]
MTARERAGREFYKMSGSGNDFVFFDCRQAQPGDLSETSRIIELCARGPGVGADGVVFILPASEGGAYRMRYFNADGSPGALCGNATLCSVRLAVELGFASPDGFELETDAGTLAARFRDGLPEIDLEAVTEVQPLYAPIQKSGEESLLGFALAGVPHVVIACPDVESADVLGRGAELRSHPSLADGANVDFLSESATGWSMRTYERGVEGETLACGTGAVASAILLKEWGRIGDQVSLRTRSGRTLDVSLRRRNEAWYPSLRGEGRVVFEGRLREV